MRILHVTDAYLPKQGGIEVQVRDLATHQQLAGHEVEVFTCAPPDGSRPGWGWTAGPTPRRDAAEPPVWRAAVPWPHVPLSNAAVHRLLDERRPDVVHVHLSVLSPLGILAVRAAAHRGIPVVVTLHSLWWWASTLYRWADVLTGWGDWAVQWTAVSDLAAAPLRHILGSRAEVAVLPNGVDAAAWAPRTDPDPDPDPDPDQEPARGSGAVEQVQVVSVMRLALRKRPRALLRVVRDATALLPDGIRLRLVVIGDGPQRRAVRRRIRRYGLTDHVLLPGRLDHDAIREVYRHSDLYLAPATLESFGIAALEARCAGLPVIARRRTGIADFVTDGVHGRLAHDDAGLTRALVELATDAARRSEMAERNRTVRPEHSWDDLLQRCDLVYKQAHELSLG